MPHEDPVLRALCEGRTPWEQVAIVAGRQERAIHVRQLRDCGLTAKTIQTATAKHQLHRLHRGVRAVGVRRLSTSGRYWAAVLAAGLDTALSDLSGAAFHGLHGWTGKVHVAAPTHRRSHRGVDVHQLSGLMPSMVMTRRGLPVLKPAHVLLDVAARLAADDLTLALNEGLARRLSVSRTSTS